MPAFLCLSLLLPKYSAIVFMANNTVLGVVVAVAATIAMYTAVRRLLWGPPLGLGDREKVLRTVLEATVAAAASGMISLVSAGGVACTSGLKAAEATLPAIYVLALSVAFYVGMLLLLVLSLASPVRSTAIVLPTAIQVIAITTTMMVTAYFMLNLAGTTVP